MVFILFFSARNFCFWSVMLLRFDDFFSSCTMYLKMFFSSTIPELPKTEVQYSKPEMTYMTFLQMNSSAGLRSDSEFIQLHSYSFSFLSFSCLCNICVFCSQRMKCLGFLIRFFFYFFLLFTFPLFSFSREIMTGGYFFFQLQDFDYLSNKQF